MSRNVLIGLSQPPVRGRRPSPGSTTDRRNNFVIQHSTSAAAPLIFERSRQKFAQPRRAEIEYKTRLVGVARQVGSLLQGMNSDPIWIPQAAQVLRDYADTIRPWATSVATVMLNDVTRRDDRAWLQASKETGRALHQEIKTAYIGPVLTGLLNDQIDLIVSLPMQAANQLTALVAEQPVDFKEALKRIHEDTRARAINIGMTEAGRSSTTLTEARASHVGSDGYIWRTQRDKRVRELHRSYEGKFFKWSSPPVADDRTGVHAHPGCIWRCRCYCEVILPTD